MYRCGSCGRPLRGQYAHCHHGCGWQNPYYREDVAYEMAVIEEVREVREEVFAEELVEDVLDGDIF